MLSITRLVRPEILVSIAVFLLIWSKYCNRGHIYKASKRVEKIIDINKLRSLDWRQFEEILADYFTMRGYHVELGVGDAADGGIDILLRKDGKKIIVQAKHYRNQVGVAIVREMYGAMIHHNADEVLICTTSFFTQHAKEFAKDKPIQLIHGHKIVNMFNTALKERGK